ncbi:MAG: hypothetical protein ACYTGN_02090 [Planctomycetota bacterium]|jgi:hypothetical protein
MKVTVEEFNKAVVVALRRLKRRVEELEARVAELEGAAPASASEATERDGTFGPQVKRCEKLSKSHQRAVHRMRKLSGKADPEPDDDIIPLPEPLEYEPAERTAAAPAKPIDLEDAFDVDL